MAKKPKTSAPVVVDTEGLDEKQAARLRFKAQRLAELEEAGELHAHDKDAPAGLGEPVEQPVTDGEVKVRANPNER